MRKIKPFIPLVVLIVACLSIAGFFGVAPRHQVVSARNKQEIIQIIRDKPMIFSPSKPYYNDLITQKKLDQCLITLQPYWESWSAPNVLHALRLWSPSSRFDEKSPFPVPTGVSPAQGNSLLQYYQREKNFRSWCRRSLPYFYRSPYGVGIRIDLDETANAHTDDFLTMAAEIKLISSTEFDWFNERFRLVDLLQHACASFHQKQEIEFTAVGLGLYLIPQAEWRNRFGDYCNFQSILDRLLKHDLSTGSCYGIHVPYALAVFLTVDREVSFLLPQQRQAIRYKLKTIANSLEAYQGAAGYWTRVWTKSRVNASVIEEEAIEWIRATGHHLEWMALVDDDLRTSDRSMRKAITFCTNALSKWPRTYLTQGRDYSPLSHVGKALLFLTGHSYGYEVGGL